MALGNAFTPDVLTWFETGLRLGAATFLPLLIGLERYLNNKPIDFRPFIIISVGACGLLIASIEMLESTADPQSRIDPTRVIEGVITGIGFLGVGAMFVKVISSRGLDRLRRFGVQGRSASLVVWASFGWPGSSLPLCS